MIPATGELWIGGQRIPDGAWGSDPTAAFAVSGLRVTWGRQTTVDQPAPSQCTFDLIDKQGGTRFDDVVHLGSTVVVWAANGSDRRPVFAGRVSDLDAGFDDDADAPLIAVIATDGIADLANRYVGAEPWSAQYAFQRVEKILAAVGNPITYAMDTSLDSAWLILSRMDVDRQAAQGLLYDIAESTGQVMWSATDTTGKPVVKFEDPSTRASQSRFLPSGGTAPPVEVVTHPAAVDDGSWRSRSTGAAGTFAISWITGGGGGPPNPAGGNYSSWARKKWSVAATASMAANGWEVFNGPTGSDWIPLTPGKVTTCSMWVKVTGAYPRKMRITMNSSTAQNIGEAYVTIASAAWTKVSVVITIPAGITGARVICEAATVAQGGTPWAVNDQLDVTGLSVTYPGDGGGGLWGPTKGGSAGVAPLDACEVLRDPVAWQRTVTDLLTRVTVRWLDQAGTGATTERSVTTVDAAAETTYGARGLSLGTILTSQADAQARVTAIMAANAPSDNWRATGLTIDCRDTVDASDVDAVKLVMNLLGAPTRNGFAIMLDSLPWWTPTDAAAQLFVEGGQYRFVDGRWLLALNTTPAAGTGATLTLAQVDRTVRYVDVDPTVRYVDMVGVGP